MFRLMLGVSRHVFRDVAVLRYGRRFFNRMRMQACVRLCMKDAILRCLPYTKVRSWQCNLYQNRKSSKSPLFTVFFTPSLH